MCYYVFLFFGASPTLNAKGVYMSDAEILGITAKINLRIYRKTLLNMRRGQHFYEATTSAIKMQAFLTSNPTIRATIEDNRAVIQIAMAGIISKRHATLLK